MKIRIIHPSFLNVGGAERVVYFLAREFDAKIFTAGIREDIDDYFPKISSYLIDVGHIVYKRKNSLSIFLDFMKANIDADFSIYVTPRSVFLMQFLARKQYLYYLTTPPRHTYVAYDILKAHMKYSDKLKLFCEKSFNDFTWKQFVKYRIDFNKIVTISKTTYKRFYEIFSNYPSGYVYPPIERNKYYNKSSEDFYLSVNRLEDLKRVDWQIKAFRDTSERLLIVGQGTERKKLEGMIDKYKMDNVKMLGNVTEKELIELYGRCKALIYTTYKCEFGLVCIEAMASGKPVLAVKEGGPTEYIVEGKNGYLFRNIDELRNLIKSLTVEKCESMKKDCINTSKKFDVSIWKKKMQDIIEDVIIGS